MRRLVWKAASQLENGLDATRAAHARAGLRGREVHEDRRQRPAGLGGHGFIREHPVEMWYRNARTLGGHSKASCAL